MTGTGLADISDGERNRVLGDFGELWVEALTVAAGAVPYEPRRDIGCDFKAEHPPTGRTIGFQVKTTESPTIVGGVLRFDLDIATFDKLRNNVLPSYLAVVVITRTAVPWTAHVAAGSVVRARCHCVKINGMPPTANSTTTRVSLPAGTLLTPARIWEMVGGRT